MNQPTEQVRAGEPPPGDPPTFYEGVEVCRHCGRSYVDHCAHGLPHRQCPVRSSPAPAAEPSDEAVDAARKELYRDANLPAYVRKALRAAYAVDFGASQPQERDQ